MKPKDLIKSLTDAVLSEAILEVDAWRSTGLLPGDVLRGIAYRVKMECGHDEHTSLQIAETEIVLEGALRFVSLVKR